MTRDVKEYLEATRAEGEQLEGPTGRALARLPSCSGAVGPGGDTFGCVSCGDLRDVAPLGEDGLTLSDDQRYGFRLLDVDVTSAVSAPPVTKLRARITRSLG